MTIPDLLSPGPLQHSPLLKKEEEKSLSSLMTDFIRLRTYMDIWSV